MTQKRWPKVFLWPKFLIQNYWRPKILPRPKNFGSKAYDQYFLGRMDPKILTVYAGFWKGGAKTFRKFEKNKDLNQKLFHPKSVRFLAQNLVKSKKKSSSLKFSPVFRPNMDTSLNKMHKTLPFVWSNLMPNLQRGEPCRDFAYYSVQLHDPGDPKGGPRPNGLPKYAPAYEDLLWRKIKFLQKELL